LQCSESKNAKKSLKRPRAEYKNATGREIYKLCNEIVNHYNASQIFKWVYNIAWGFSKSRVWFNCARFRDYNQGMVPIIIFFHFFSIIYSGDNIQMMFFFVVFQVNNSSTIIFHSALVKRRLYQQDIEQIF
jgi:hypothetical protein